MKWLLGLIGFNSPYTLIGAIAIASGLFFWGRYEGGSQQRLEDQAATVDSQNQAIETFKREEITLSVVSVNLEQKLERLNVVHTAATELVNEIIDRPPYRNVCVDDDGLRAINSILAGTPLDPGKPDDALLSPGPAH